MTLLRRTYIYPSPRPHKFRPARLANGDPTYACRDCGQWWSDPAHYRGLEPDDYEPAVCCVCGRDQHTPEELAECIDSAIGPRREEF